MVLFSLAIAGKMPINLTLFAARRLGRECSSGVEHNLAKVGVEGSNPFTRSIKSMA